MLVLDRILAIPDYAPDFVQMGLTTREWAIIEKTGKTKDGKAAKPSVLKQDRSKTLIKGDKKLSEVSESPKPVFRELDSSIAKKVKGAIAGVKGGKVVKGKSPSDRSAKPKPTSSLRILSDAESAQNRKDLQKNKGKLAALADSAIAEFSRKGAKSHNDNFTSTLEVNGEKLPALFTLQKDKHTTNGSVIVLKDKDAYRITFKVDANTNKRKSQRITQVKDQGLIGYVRQQIKNGKENILQYEIQQKYKWINGVKVEV